MSLPVQLTTFVGRLAETGALVDLLQRSRLVTLTGPGGSGKTRLALHVATDSASTSVFADLSPIDDECAVVRVLAESVGAGAPTVAAIAAATEDPVLLIVDNCEHVVDTTATVLDALLRAAPAITVLATGREPLGIDGEVIYRVPPLEPDDAAALFIERSGRARPGRPAPEPAVVGEICDRLDGMPLAIELAAARMRVLSADQIRDGLHDRFRLLTGGTRTAVQRQQTLQASVDWSHNLLQEDERVTLRRLAVFAGGFSIDAAEAVAGWDPIGPHHVLDLVSQLVDKSLVVVGADERLRLLETVRQYAAEKLVDASEAEETRRRHYDHVLSQAWRRRDAGESDAEHRARIRADIENVRRVLQWAVDHPDPGPIVELTSRLYPYWVQGANLREGADWTAHAAERTRGAGADVRAPLLRRYTQLRGLSGDFAEAWPIALEAIELARAAGDQRNLVLLLTQATSFARNIPVGDAPELLDEAITIARELGLDAELTYALYMKAFSSWRDNGDLAAGERIATEALELSRASGATNIERLSEALLAKLRFVRGEVATATGPLEAAAARLREVGETFIFGQTVAVLAHLKALMGDDAGANQLIAELDAIAAEGTSTSEQILTGLARGLVSLASGDTSVIERLDEGAMFERLATAAPQQRVWTYGFASLAFARAGELERAAELADQLVRLNLHAGPIPAPTLPAGIVAAIAGDLAAAERHLIRAIEWMTTTGVSAAWARTQSLLTLAAIAAKRDELADATRIFGSVYEQAAELGMSTTTHAWTSCAEEKVYVCRTALGDELFEQIWDQGAQLGWEEIVQYLLRGRGARRRPTVGWESLTPTELRVVELVAEGLSNKTIAEKLYMSVPTVKSHLTHVYTKLSMRSRTELGAAYVRRAGSTTSARET